MKRTSMLLLLAAVLVVAQGQNCDQHLKKKPCLGENGCRWLHRKCQVDNRVQGGSCSQIIKKSSCIKSGCSWRKDSDGTECVERGTPQNTYLNSDDWEAWKAQDYDVLKAALVTAEQTIVDLQDRVDVCEIQTEATEHRVDLVFQHFIHNELTIFPTYEPTMEPNGATPLRYSFAGSTMALHPLDFPNTTQETIVQCNDNPDISSLTKYSGWTASYTKFSTWVCQTENSAAVTEPHIRWYEDTTPSSWLEYTVPAGYTKVHVRCCGRSGSQCGILKNGNVAGIGEAQVMKTVAIAVQQGDVIRMQEFKNNAPTPHEIVWTSFLQVE